MMFSKNTNNATEGSVTKKSWKERVATVAIPAVGVAVIGGAAAGIVHIIRGKKDTDKVLDNWTEDDIPQVQTESQPEAKAADPQKAADQAAMETIISLLDLYEPANDETVLAAGDSFIAAGAAVCTEEFYERNFQTNLKFFGRYERMVKRIRDLQDAEAKRSECFEAMYNRLKMEMDECTKVLDGQYDNDSYRVDDLKRVLPLAEIIPDRIDHDFGMYLTERDDDLYSRALTIDKEVMMELEWWEKHTTDEAEHEINDFDPDVLAEKMNASAIPDQTDASAVSEDSADDAEIAAELAKEILSEIVKSVVD